MTRDRWGAQPGNFNRPVAEVVYKALMSLPDDESVAVHGRVLVAACVEHELVSHAGEIKKVLDRRAEVRAQQLDRGLARQALAKARRFEDNTDELRSLAILHKAGFDFSDEQRRRFAEQQRRDLKSGRFVRKEHLVQTDKGIQAVSPEHEARLGIAPAEHLSGKDRSHYQQAYAQIRDMLAEFEGLGSDALAHAHITDDKGKPKGIRHFAVPDRGEQHGLSGVLHPGERVHKLSISVAPPVTAAGAAYDALAGVSPTAAEIGYTSVKHGFLDPTRLSEFREDQSTVNTQDDFVPSARAFRSLENGSKLLSDSLGDAAPRKVRYALAVSQHVGRLGPEAQKVVGPAADRAAYRYRGTERALPQGLVNSLQTLAGSGVGDKRWYLLHGNAKPDGSTPPEQWSPSSTLGWFRTQLPAADLSTLHLKSGAVPPSRGVVFDKDGRTYVEAVGYADDHYVPFNLKGKSLRSLKGGEYIRTRTFGGPTTEDIHAALFSGAQGFAVVSHNGVFTVDFASDLKGGKRFNDNAARMTARYGYLLDAVRSRQVTTGGVAPSRLAEIDAQAEDVYPADAYPEQHKKELARLVDREKKHPQLSQQQKLRAATQFWENQLPGGRGVGSSRQHMASAYIEQEAEARHNAAVDARQGLVHRHPEAAGSYPPPSLDVMRAQVRDEVAGADPLELSYKLADATGQRPALDAAIKRAEEENKARLTPLRLNGDGYAKALKALQEEFPHYIADTQFHPWSTTQGPSDSGYVRPKHLRPAEALAGYFDQHVSRVPGRTKVYADSVRYQNGQRAPRDVPTGERTTNEGATATTADKPKDDAEAVRQQADRALFQSINGAENFAGTARDGGKLDGAVLQGKAVSGYLADPEVRKELERVAPNLISLHQMTPEAFDEAYVADPRALRAKLAGAAREEKLTGWLGVPADVLSAHERGGAPAPARKLKERMSDELEQAHADHDFPEPAFSAETQPNTDAVKRLYGSDAAIQKLVGRGDLPNSPDAGELKARADELIKDLKGKRDALRARSARGDILPPNSYAGIDQSSEGVLRALQLHRRHGEAASREAGARAQAEREAAPDQRVENNIVLPSPPLPEDGESEEDYNVRFNKFMAANRRMMAEFAGDTGGPDNSRVING